MKLKRTVALDLGNSAFRLAWMERGEGKEKITHLRLVELPPQASAEGRAAALRSLVQGLDLSDLQEVIALVDDPYACLRPVLLPPMPPHELSQAAAWQLQPVLAIPPEEARVECDPLPGRPGDDSKKRRYLAMAYPSAAIQTELALLGQVGIRPTRLLPTQVAVGAWIQRQSPSLGQAEAAVLEIGASGCEFLVLEGGRPVFTRKIPEGAAAWAREMTGMLMTAQGQVSLTAEEAETFKRDVGIPHPTESASMGVRGISAMQIFSLIRGSLERLVTEVERSLAFYGESGGRAQVAQLCLIGDSAQMKGLPAWIQERLGIPVKLISPLNELFVADGALQEAAAAAPLSLVPVLGALYADPKGVNFLPAELREGLQRQVKRAAVRALATAVILGAILLWIGERISIKTLREKIAAAQTEEQTVTPHLGEIRAVVLARQKMAQEPNWEGVFRRLSQAVPAEITLTEWAAQGGEVSLKGRVRRGTRPTEEILGGFLQALARQGMSEVRLRSSRLSDPSGGITEFDLTGKLR